MDAGRGIQGRADAVHKEIQIQSNTLPFWVEEKAMKEEEENKTHYRVSTTTET
jgi:hypothetical protein